MKYELAIWDFDGTLADTLKTGLQFFNESAARYGFRPIDDPASARNMTTREFLKFHRISFWLVPKLFREFTAWQSHHINQISLFAGIQEVVQRLHACGCKLGVVSSNSEPNIRTCLEVNQVAQNFGFVTGYSRLFGKKRVLKVVLKRYGVAANKVVYVGDEVRDIEAARAAGVSVAAVAWGFNSAPTLEQSSPDYLAHDPAEMMSIVESWM